MALDPQTIREEREKIPQFHIEGKILSSELKEKDHQGCIDKYESVLYDGIERITFQYNVTGPAACIIDGIYDIETKPFEKDTGVYVSLTKTEPHIMIAGGIQYLPKSHNLQKIHAVGTVIILVIFLLIYCYRKK